MIVCGGSTGEGCGTALASIDEPCPRCLAPRCSTCGGAGWVATLACCGDVLPSGECCAAVYGEARLVPDQVYCPACGGQGWP